jgi:hypothetical protein
MSKKLLIYQSAVPVSALRHGKMSYEPSDTYAFTADINAVPLMAVELLRAATEYAIVFATVGDEVLPAAVLGVKPDQNLYLTPDAHWQAKYIPAFIRRYPFVFATSEDRKTLTLCIDESHPGLNSEGRGHPLFTDEGKPSPYVEKVLQFLKEYQGHFERTKFFGRHLKELGLLEPMQANVTTPKGEKLSLGGFSAVTRSKLRALSGDALASLVATDELELLYLHLYSLRNFSDVKDKLLGSLAEPPDTPTLDAPPVVH